VKKLFLIFLISTALACSSKVEKPEKFIPREKMISLLIDMHLSEGKAFALAVDQDSSKVLAVLFGHQALQKHGYDEPTFIANYEYYLQELDQMSYIYRAVVDSLSLRESILKLD
jgi:hypothetical protein